MFFEPGEDRRQSDGHRDHLKDIEQTRAGSARTVGIVRVGIFRFCRYRFNEPGSFVRLGTAVLFLGRLKRASLRPLARTLKHQLPAPFDHMSARLL